MSAEIIEFEYMEEDSANPLKAGHWTWRVINNLRTPVCSCPICGSQYWVDSSYTIASDGLVGSPGGRAFICRKAPTCPMQGRFLLKGFKAHRKMVD